MQMLSSQTEYFLCNYTQIEDFAKSIARQSTHKSTAYAERRRAAVITSSSTDSTPKISRSSLATARHGHDECVSKFV